MSSAVRISLVSTDPHLSSHIQLRLQSKGYQVALINVVSGILGVFYSDPPDMMVIDFSVSSDAGRSVVAALRNDSFFSVIPIIGVVASCESGPHSWDSCQIDDFVTLPINYGELFCRITLSLARIKRIFDNNPLTRLPGNTSIQHAIEDAMGKPLAVCYLDINHFKPYNDSYGFSHGDEVIRMTARIMSNAVRESGSGFCGHIGGDDFVFIVPAERIESVCQTVISHFDLIVLDMFDEETKARGSYPGYNRKGEREDIPLLSISIAVVPMDMPKIQHAAKVSEVAAELKRLAKDSKGSRFVIDQRKR